MVTGRGNHQPPGLAAVCASQRGAGDPFPVQMQRFWPLLGTSRLWIHNKDSLQTFFPATTSRRFQGTKTFVSGLAMGKTFFVHQVEFLVTTGRTKAAFVYLGQETFPLHPDLCMALLSSQSTCDGLGRGKKHRAPSESKQGLQGPASHPPLLRFHGACGSYVQDDSQ